MNRPISSNETQVPRSPNRPPNSAGDRPVVQQQGARMAFNQKLEDAERRFQSRSMSSTAERASGEQWQRERDFTTSRDSSNNGDWDDDDVRNDHNPAAVGQQPVPSLIILGEATTQTGLANLNLLQSAYLDRMAAAIAEIAELGSQNIFTIEFGADVSIAKSAILGWDKTGALSVRVLTTDVAMSPHAALHIREQLRERLQRRRIAVTSIEVAEIPDTRPGKKSTEQDDRVA
jgi:hypothetical protein